MQALLALVAVIVAGAGNLRGQPGGSVNVNLYPAIAAANYPNIVVFGSVDTCGETGTSYAAGMVSGLHGSEPCAIPEPGTVRTAGAVKNRITEEA